MAFNVGKLDRALPPIGAGEGVGGLPPIVAAMPAVVAGCRGVLAPLGARVALAGAIPAPVGPTE